MESLKALVIFGYFVSGVIAFFAVISGLQEWVGLHWALSGIAAFILVSVSPLLAMIVGIAGAITAWSWPWYFAVLLFLWPVVLSLIVGGSVMGLVGAGQLIRSMKRGREEADRLGREQL